MPWARSCVASARFGAIVDILLADDGERANGVRLVLGVSEGQELRHAWATYRLPPNSPTIKQPSQYLPEDITTTGKTPASTNYIVIRTQR